MSATPPEATTHPPAQSMSDERREGVPYHRIHRLGAWGPHGWWRGLVGSLVIALGMFVIVPIVIFLGFLVYFLLAGGDVIARIEALVDIADVTPATLVYVNLTLAGAIPVTWFVTRVLHGLRPRWLSSVGPRIRWRWFAISLGLALVALIATVAVSSVLPAQADGVAVAGNLNEFTDTARDFLLVVVLLTPLQAAGEEYVFRGYLTQALGGLVRSPRVGLVVAVAVPAVLFALAHGAQDPPIFVDRLAFGIVAGILTIATGGLEAAIAMHVLNNLLAFGLALAFGDMTSALNPSGGTWWSLPVTLTQSVVYTVLAVVVARRMGVVDRTTPAAVGLRGSSEEPPEGVLEGSGTRV